MTQRHIGRYLLQEEVGRGGMGVVYAALDESQGRRVALKLLRPGGPGEDAVAADRFLQEMQIAIALEHPNVVPVYETGSEDGVRYIAMRLVDGEDLGAVIRREGALAPERVARLGRQVASALDAAHARGLVHRDVKPGNVLLTGSGDEEHAYLTDFGLTRDVDGGITQTGQWIGTVDYAAPEQIEAAPLTARTDVYALGCVFFHMLTGQLPFQGTFAAKAMGHATRPLPSVDLPGDLGLQIDRVLAIATAKDPLRRHASAGALARALARIVSATPSDLTQRTAAMAPLLPDDEEPATAIDARAPRAPLVDVPQRPRERARPLAPAPVASTVAARRDRRAPTLVAALLATVLVLGVAVALLLGGSGDNSSTRASRGKTSSSSGTTTSKTNASAPRKTSSGAASTPAPPAAVAAIPTAGYTAAAGGYTAQVPSGGGWSNQGERNTNGIIRTTFTGPGGQQLWIDATPTMAPGFGREGRTQIQMRTLTGPLGTIAGYRFIGAPTDVCATGCVDYQLDLGGRGYAVLAGGAPSARLAARKTILSLQETAPPQPAATSTPPPPTVKHGKDGQQKGKQQEGKQQEG
jgi:hypothetical protein